MDGLRSLIQSRRSIRRFTEQTVPERVIKSLLESAGWAPSAHNRQPWRFAVIRGETQVALAKAMGVQLRSDLLRDDVPLDVIEADVSRSFDRLTSASALIVLCLSMIDMDTYPDTHRQQNEHIMAVQSVAMAGQNILLMAHDQGLGACWMCAPLFCPDVVRGALALPSDWEPQGIIALGYPAQSRDKTRHPIESKVIWR